jgi:hypothetical protein
LRDAGYDVAQPSAEKDAPAPGRWVTGEAPAGPRLRQRDVESGDDADTCGATLFKSGDLKIGVTSVIPVPSTGP